MSRAPAGTAIVLTDETVQAGLERARETPDATLVGVRELRARLTDATPFLDVADLDVGVTPPYLRTSYAIYRTLRAHEFDTVVFPERGGHAYCSLRARETGSALASTRIVVDCGAGTLGSLEDSRPTYVSKNVLGILETERLVRELVDRDVRQTSTHSARPLVSVVVPVYERTRYLGYCLDGLARQTYEPLEVIVADDGSTSGDARAHLDELERARWPWPLRVVRLPHGGPAHARNGGFRAATGELVTFVDDDDVPFDDMVETLWRAREAARVDVAVGAARLFRGEAEPTAAPGDVIRIPLCEPRELGLLSNQFGGPVALWPRRLLDSLGGFPDSPVEDWLLFARATAGGVRLTAPPDPVHWYRQAGASRYSANTHAMRDAGIAEIADVYAQRLPEDLRLLPRLAAGVYAELERRSRVRGSGRARDAVRSVARRIARR